MSEGPERRRSAGGAPELAGELAILTEWLARAWQPVAEFGMLLADPVFWGLGVPRGDGHPVLVLPGLLGGDLYLEPLHGWLRRLGYATVRSGIDVNRGWSEELVQRLGELAETASQGGRRPLTIIGHSAGGMLGRSVARRRPHTTRHLITLGSPLFLSRTALPDTMRLTAIYSRDDEVVPHPAAVASERNAANVEVRGSHLGLASNPRVYRVLAERLSDAPRDASS